MAIDSKLSCDGSNGSEQPFISIVGKKFCVVCGANLCSCIDLSNFFMPVDQWSNIIISLKPNETKKIDADNIGSMGERIEVQASDVSKLLIGSPCPAAIKLRVMNNHVDETIIAILDKPCNDIVNVVSALNSELKKNDTIYPLIDVSAYDDKTLQVKGKMPGDSFTYILNDHFEEVQPVTRWSKAGDPKVLNFSITLSQNDQYIITNYRIGMFGTEAIKYEGTAYEGMQSLTLAEDVHDNIIVRVNGLATSSSSYTSVEAPSPPHPYTLRFTPPLSEGDEYIITNYKDDINGLSVFRYEGLDIGSNGLDEVVLNEPMHKSIIVRINGITVSNDFYEFPYHHMSDYDFEIIQSAERYLHPMLKFIILQVMYDEINALGNQKHIRYAYNEDYLHSEYTKWRNMGKLLIHTADSDVLETDTGLIETLWLHNPLDYTVKVTGMIAS